NVLFGSVFGISASSAEQAALISVFVCVAICFLGRPLLFASVDPFVAVARGVPARSLGIAFMVIAGLIVAEATQVVGALLLLGLVATPAAAAHQLSANPCRALWLSAGLCLADVWVGLLLSYYFPSLPPSFALVGVAF